ncbi:hypothetical protein [Nocardia paucivorans]|uniref:hypothetical protein n=1 Tax=Nocardia paucivorans TaxID=114259 RepID=UPI0005942F0D|nr:hypothetical protein [Nocardia paucivorans]
MPNKAMELALLVRDGALRLVRSLGKYAQHDSSSISILPNGMRRFTDEIAEKNRTAGDIVSGQGPKTAHRDGGSGSRSELSRRVVSDPRVNSRIGEDLAERHNLDVFGFGTPGFDTHTVREFVTGIDDMLTKYPKTSIVAVRIDRLKKGARSFAESWESKSLVDHPPRYGTAIAFSEKYAKDPNLLAERARRSVEKKHFPPGADERPAYYAAIHEFGHALSDSGKSKALDKAEETLKDYYSRKYGHRNDGMTYEQWRDQLSGYGFHDDGSLNPVEALAESFFDVEMNGAQASEPAQVLHKLLLDTAESEWRKRD